MTKPTTTDFAENMRTMAIFLQGEINSAINSPHMDPLSWRVDIDLYRAMLRTMESHASLWQERIDLDAEADRHAKEEEIANLTNAYE